MAIIKRVALEKKIGDSFMSLVFDQTSENENVVSVSVEVNSLNLGFSMDLNKEDVEELYKLTNEIYWSMPSDKEEDPEVSLVDTSINIPRPEEPAMTPIYHKPTYTIEDLYSGKVALIHDGTLDNLNKVLSVAFRASSRESDGRYFYYHMHKEISGEWKGSDKIQEGMPIQSASEFLKQC